MKIATITGERRAEVIEVPDPKVADHYGLAGSPKGAPMNRHRRAVAPWRRRGHATVLLLGAGVLAVMLFGGVIWASQQAIPCVTPPAQPAAKPALAIPRSSPAPRQDQSPPQEKPKHARRGAERPGWKLVWFDEFDKDGAPDPAKWKYEVGFVRNNELQYYTKDRRENARIEGGSLVIEGRKERFANPTYKADAKGGWKQTKQFADYTAASLTTRGLAEWTYGRIEVRAKLPTGRGTWPAIWMLGNNIGKEGWPKCGEIDIMENVGFDPDGIHTTVHTGKYNHVKHTAKGHRETIAKPYADFHVYAIEWDAKKIDFLVDEKKVFTFADDGGGEDAWPFNHGHYLLLNFAIGGGWGGAKGMDESIWPQKYYIDYVRVYERP